MLSRRNVLLSVLIAVLVVARLVVGGGVASTGDVGQLLLNVDPAAVQAVELQRGKEIVRLERVAKAQWIVASHGKIPAREGAVESLIERLRGWRVERIAGEDPSQHADFAVDAEQARQVRLLDGEGKLLAGAWVGRVTGAAKDLARDRGFQIDLGDLGLLVRVLEPGGEGPRARTDVVNDFVAHQLDAKPSVWFVRPLLKGERERVTRIEVLSGSGYDLQVQPEARVAGDPRPVDAPRVFASLASLYLLEALAPALTPPPADALRLRVHVQSEDPQTLQLWSQGKRWFLAQGQISVEVRAGDAEVVARLARKENLLRRELVRMGAETVRRVHWQRGREERSLIRGRTAIEAVTTGAERPLRARQPTQGEFRAFAKRLVEASVTEWISDAAQVSEALARADERLVVVGGMGKEVLTLGPVGRDGRRAVASSLLPGVAAWIEAANVDALHAALQGICPE